MKAAWTIGLYALLFAAPLIAKAEDCKFSYLGVIGKSANSIAVFTETSSGRTIVARQGEVVKNCNVRVESIARNMIIISDIDYKRIILRPQGNEAGKDKARSPSLPSNSELMAHVELSSELESQSFDQILELGQAAVLEGSITPDEVNQIIAEEEEMKSYLDLTDKAFKAKGLY